MDKEKVEAILENFPILDSNASCQDVNTKVFTKDGLVFDIRNVGNLGARAHPTFIPSLRKVDVSCELVELLEARGKTDFSTLDAVLKEALKIAGTSTKPRSDMGEEEEEEEEVGFMITFTKEEIIISRDKGHRQLFGYMGAVSSQDEPVFGIISYGTYWEFIVLRKGCIILVVRGLYWRDHQMASKTALVYKRLLRGLYIYLKRLEMRKNENRKWLQ